VLKRKKLSAQLISSLTLELRFVREFVDSNERQVHMDTVVIHNVVTDPNGFDIVVSDRG
jgi:hypothetical protein